MSADTGKADYIIVGSGAGGGTLAARLAEAGKRVVLLEAGGDPVTAALEGAGIDGLPEDYQVPAFHGQASENKALKWDFYVNHYTDAGRRRRDPKYRQNWSRETEPPSAPALGHGRPPNEAVGPDRDDTDGILYPRAGTLGGCTAHNGMIIVAPHNADWNAIEALTGDPSWSPESMRKYFQRWEDCHHRPWWRRLSRIGLDRTRHGFNGWLRTETPVPWRAVRKDKGLVKALWLSAKSAADDLSNLRLRLWWAVLGKGDPNDWRLVRENAVGLRCVPLSTRRRARAGTRERLREVAAHHPLDIRLNALATRVIFDGTRAVGVEYLEGGKLYRAHYAPSREEGTTRQVFTADGGEVILAGGAFNTPQLLMLSGIGPPGELERHAIGVVVPLAGVGRNLQDRYEVAVINRTVEPWTVLREATFTKGDSLYRQWERRKGVYTANGVVLSVIKKSRAAQSLPDLFIFALLGLFRGYFPNYSSFFARNPNYLTWAILKAHTVNTAGYVRLRSSDPRDTPEINFKYFDEGNDRDEEDVRAVLSGVKFVRDITRPLVEKGFIAEEVSPGPRTESDADLMQWIKDHAWGHHASCTCPIGPREGGGVVNGDFEVHGTQGLRIVDASVFPRVPGFFIVSSVYTIAEKAAEVILAKAASSEGRT